MKFDILSLFPEYFDSPFSVSMLKRAKQNDILEIQSRDIREFASGKHKQVDDRPFGGGPGMVLMAEPVCRAIDYVRQKKSKVIYLTPQGKPLNAKACKRFAKEEHIVLLCGHYEGIDERVMDRVDEEVSIGDFVLTSGCPAAIVFIDAVTRFLPGVIGHPDAVKFDSFEQQIFDSPHYTRPNEFEGKKVPDVLLRGHHEEIDAWRKNQAMEKTKKIRPDLYDRYINKETSRESVSSN